MANPIAGMMPAAISRPWVINAGTKDKIYSIAGTPRANPTATTKASMTLFKIE